MLLPKFRKKFYSGHNKPVLFLHDLFSRYTLFHNQDLYLFLLHIQKLHP